MFPYLLFSCAILDLLQFSLATRAKTSSSEKRRGNEQMYNNYYIWLYIYEALVIEKWELDYTFQNLASLEQ